MGTGSSPDNHVEELNPAVANSKEEVHEANREKEDDEANNQEEDRKENSEEEDKNSEGKDFWRTMMLIMHMKRMLEGEEDSGDDAWWEEEDDEASNAEVDDEGNNEGEVDEANDDKEENEANSQEDPKADAESQPQLQPEPEPTLEETEPTPNPTLDQLLSTFSESGGACIRAIRRQEPSDQVLKMAERMHEESIRLCKRMFRLLEVTQEAKWRRTIEQSIQRRP